MVLFLQASVIPSEKWEVWSPRSPGAPISWDPAALASPFPLAYCQLNQPFPVWSGGLRPNLHPYLAVNTCRIHCSSPFSTGPCPQNRAPPCPPPPPAASPTRDLAAFPPPRSHDNPTSSAGERVCCSEGVGVGWGRGRVIIFYIARNCSVLSP